MDQQKILRINKMLKDKYGSDVSGRPYFRVVWVEDLYENRQGTYREFHGPIYLRTVTGVARVRKYNYIHDRWIFERLISGDRVVQSVKDEVIGAENGSYEHLWTFEWPENKTYQEPEEWAADYLAHFATHGKPQDSPQEMERQKVSAQDKEIAEDMSILKDEAPPFDGGLHVGHAVVNPGVPKNE